jgi:pyruvate/2-oxoglutarate dehydrogenase complex dihydrolipoamide dehydrogenase (E3) component
LGGGPVGTELAQAFARLGAAVTLVGKAAQLLPREDPDVAALVTERLSAEGITVLTGHEAKAFQGHTLVAETSAGQEVKIPFDQILVALGRKANASGFGLEELGVKLHPQGTIAASPILRTNISSIYVCGDVTGPYQFTHTAAHQAWYASVNALFSPFKTFKVDYRVIPWATFTDPEVARVGLNEQAARVANIPYELTHYHIDDLDRAIADGEAQGLIKVLTRPGSDKILGVTIVAHHAGEMIAEYILAMKQGLGLNRILSTIHIYPTLSEANKYVAGNWRRARQPALLVTLLEKFHAWRR